MHKYTETAGGLRFEQFAFDFCYRENTIRLLIDDF